MTVTFPINSYNRKEKEHCIFLDTYVQEFKSPADHTININDITLEQEKILELLKEFYSSCGIGWGELNERISLQYKEVQIQREFKINRQQTTILIYKEPHSYHGDVIVIQNSGISYIVGDEETLILKGAHKSFYGPSTVLSVEVEDNTMNIFFATGNSKRLALFADFTEKNLLVYKKKKQERLINIITKSSKGLDTTEFELEDQGDPTDSLKTNYNDDFVDFHKHITKTLDKTRKGIIMLHGKPGTGKTSYIKALIATANRKIIYVPNELSKSLGDPSFMTLLHKNTGCILIIEDAEEILMSRGNGGNPAVSNILNLCDGILSDCLAISVIATFNSDLADIDSALKRPGRLVGEYCFGSLSRPKATDLLRKLYGGEIEASAPMTLAEIYSYGEEKFIAPEKKSAFGFSR